MSIDSYRFGHIVIRGEEYVRDVIVAPQWVWDGWWREQGHRLSVADLQRALGADPDVLIVGTGFFGLVQVPAETVEEVESRGIELLVLPTRKAWMRYNELVDGERTVVAAFHLAC